MQHYHEQASEFGVNQLLLLSGFLEVKIEFLALLELEEVDASYVLLAQHQHDLFNLLQRWNDAQRQVDFAGSLAAYHLKKRGENVWLRKVQEHLADFEQLISSEENHFAHLCVEAWEQELIVKTMASLLQVVRSMQKVTRNNLLFSVG
jgi:hypothetical protein